MLHTATIELPTTKKQEMIDVTKRVRAVVAASNVQSGLCSVYCGHTTGAVTLNENTDPDVQTDILNALERAVPRNEKYYKHEEGNAHAHAKAAAGRASRAEPCRSCTRAGCPSDTGPRCCWTRRASRSASAIAWGSSVRTAAARAP